MIYTQYGEKIRITDNYGDGRVQVQSIEDPTWIRNYDLYRLKAEGGIDEIKEQLARLPNSDWLDKLPGEE